MNACRQTKWISAYIDGELEQSRREALRAHLEACPICREEYQTLLALHDTLHAEPAPGIPMGLNDRLHQAFAQAPKRGRSGLRIASAIATATAICVLGTAGILYSLSAGGAANQMAPMLAYEAVMADADTSSGGAADTTTAKNAEASVEAGGIDTPEPQQSAAVLRGAGENGMESEPEHAGAIDEDADAGAASDEAFFSLQDDAADGAAQALSQQSVPQRRMWPYVLAGGGVLALAAGAAALILRRRK